MKKTQHLIALVSVLVSFIVLIIPFSSHAEDTAVYDISANVKPNVLIIFDNSISMSADVPYNDAEVYMPLTYVTNTIYQRSCTRYRHGVCQQYSWVVYTGTFTDANLDGKHDPDPNNIQRGNRRNYDSNPPGDKIDAAKTVAKAIIDATYQYVRLGIMLLHGNVGWDTLPAYHQDNTVLSNARGGSEIKDWTAFTKETLKGYVDNFAAIGATPLAVRLINAAEYFKHEDNDTLPAHYAWGNFGADGGFADPITAATWCRKNYIIIVTDGRPTYEGDTTSSSDQNEGQFDYIESFLPSRTDTEVETPPPGANKHGRHNYDYDATNNPDDWDPWGASTGNRYTGFDCGGGSDYLDDVAKYLYDTDLRPEIDGTQNITTFTIGFAVDDPLLQDAADNGHGEYHTAYSYDQLEQALLNVMTTIIDRAQTFTAPVVPVQRTTSGDKMYISLFTPRSTQKFWPGYLVKLKIGDNGELMGFSSGYASGTEVQVTESNGMLNEDLLKSDRPPYPYWDAQNKLITRSTERNIYTYLGNADLNNSSNVFVTTNSAITLAMLGTPTTGTSPREDLINYIRGTDAYDEDMDSNCTEKRESILGDILHSKPLIIDYEASNPTNPHRVIYVGTNDGMLHAFDDTDGSEKWGFIPPDLLPNLKNIVEGTGHQYYVDSSPQAYTLDGNHDGDLLDVGTDKVIIVFGERRGGTSYCALDVTNPDDPQYLWRIDKANSTITGIPNPTIAISELGQSWSEPQVGKVKAGTVGAEIDTIVAILGGGYSDVNSAGRALYLINVLNGTLVKSFTSSDHASLTKSIPSTVLAVDTNFDGYVNRVYVGDLGGQMWRCGNQAGTEDGNVNNWTPRRLFASSLTGAKIFYPPDMVLQQGYAYLYFGTGDREDPMSMTGTNRLYALKDKNVIGSYTTLVDTNLVNVTDDQLQDPGVSEEDKQTLRDLLATGNGWYITLDSAEKVLAPTTVISGVVLFTTFTPVDTVANPCSYGGDARLYAVDYLTAVSVIDFDEDGDLDISDLSKEIGQGIPTEVVITITDTGEVRGYIGAGGGIVVFDLTGSVSGFQVDAWREMF